ncbi:hypothetical protein [Sediminibacterium sp.]|uniref:hypothetical protein n=1 Tax=Sediminibacterium sp. TaxID=1917865 RepID=UPI003F699263
MSREKELLEQVDQLQAALKSEKEISLELSENCSKLEQANQEIGSLKAALIDELEKTKAELAEALEANKILMKTMEDLSTMPDAAEKPSQPSSTNLAALSFTKDGVKYGFNFGKITHKKMPISAAEVAVDEKLQDELIALKSGMLKVL